MFKFGCALYYSMAKLGLPIWPWNNSIPNHDKHQWLLLQFIVLLMMDAKDVSGTTMPIIRSSRVLYGGCCLWYFVLWFSSCWSGVELRVMCPVCRMVLYWLCFVARVVLVTEGQLKKRVYNFLLYFSHKKPDDSTLWPKHVAAIYNCYSKTVHWQAMFLLLVCIVEIQWGYHTIKT